mgnify:CR=1 FL=1
MDDDIEEIEPELTKVDWNEYDNKLKKLCYYTVIAHRRGLGPQRSPRPRGPLRQRL